MYQTTKSRNWPNVRKSGLDGCEQSEILEYYRNKSVFLTGGTGFLGQVLVEKLLRIGVKNVYFLIRSKRSESAMERLTKTFNGPPFENLRKLHPDFMNRVTICEGSVSEIGLGLDEAVRQDIIENVEIVIHAAADVRFDASFSSLCISNLRGTREVLELSMNIQLLQSFTYISTAYSQCVQRVIGEQFYEAPMAPDLAISLAERFEKSDSHILKTLTARIVSPWPNTYVFSKAVTEELVRQYSLRLPVAVVRPSIIIPTFNEPIPGWINNAYGTTGALVAAGVGFNLINYKFNPNKKVNLVCADYVMNSILAVAWNTFKENDMRSLSPKKTSQMKTNIYNATVAAEQEITFGTMVSTMQEVGKGKPFKSTIRYPLWKKTDNILVYKYHLLIHHIIPFTIIDIVNSYQGCKIRLMPLFRKAYNFAFGNCFFSSHDWKFEMGAMSSVYDKMSPADKKNFPCDLRQFIWKDFIHTYFMGIKVHILKEEPGSRYDPFKYSLHMFAYYLIRFILYSSMAYISVLILQKFGITKPFENIFYSLSGTYY